MDNYFSTRIMIISGRAADLSPVAHLMENFTANNASKGIVKVFLFENNYCVDSIFPNSTKFNHDLVNTSARTIGVYAANSFDFLEWLHSNSSKWRLELPFLTLEKSFLLPRRLYGIYLENMAIAISNQAKKYGIELHYCHVAVMDIGDNGVETISQYQSGTNFCGDIVVVV